MDFAAADAFAQKRLAQVPKLTKKVQDAKAKQSFESADSKAELAAAQQQLAQLQATVPMDSKLQAYRDRGGLISSSSKYTKKLLTVDDVKAALVCPPVGTATAGAPTMAQAPMSALPATAATALSVPTAHVPDIIPQQHAFGDRHTLHVGQPQPAKSGCVAAAPKAATADATTSSTSNVLAVPCSSSAPVQPALPTQTTAAEAVAVPSPPIVLTLDTAAASQPVKSGQSSSHHSHRSHASTTSSQKQHLHQLAMADSLLVKIDDYVAAETSSAALGLQGCQLSSPSSMAAAADHFTKADTAAAGPDAHTSSAWPGSSIGASSSGSGSGSGGGAAGTPAGAPAVLSSALLASVALRFQGFNQPPSQSSVMPDLAAMVEAVQQQEAEAAQAKQAEQQQWMAQQQRLQQAKQTAAHRHLGLYELGMAQQRRKLGLAQQRVWQRRQQASQPTAAAVAGQAAAAQPPQQEQQQPPATDAELPDQQQQQQQLVSCAAAGAGVCPAGSSTPGSARPQQQQQQTPCGLDNHHHHQQQQQQQQQQEEQQQPHTQITVGACVGETHMMTAITGQTPDTVEHSSSYTSVNGSINKSQAAPVVAAAAGIAVSARPVLQHAWHLQQQQLHQLRSKSHYTPDWLCLSEATGSSHGHLSPAAMRFDHLPGSRRQVYAQLQDALECSDAIQAAEQAMQALCYAPAGVLSSNRKNH